jgi:hypothetical protein
MDTTTRKRLRAKINSDADSLSVKIPAKKRSFIFLLFGLWLSAWIFSAFLTLSAIAQAIIFRAGIVICLILGLWTMALTLTGLYIFLICLWTLFGSEIILANENYIRISIGIGKFRFHRHYNLNSIKRIKADSRKSVLWKAEDFMPFRSGRISFNYRMRTYRFANGIDEAEAEYIIDLLKSRGLIRE